VPKVACGLDVTPLVIVDGGDDGTARVALEEGAVTFAFPVNLGHGVALRVATTFASLWVPSTSSPSMPTDRTTPPRFPQLLQPLVDDEADFVVASRRLGVDRNGDRYRQLGVVFFAWLMNLLTGAHLTDTSNGFRALRVTMLADVKGRLEQDSTRRPSCSSPRSSEGGGWRNVRRCGTSAPRASRRRGPTSSTDFVTRPCCSGPGAGALSQTFTRFGRARCPFAFGRAAVVRLLPTERACPRSRQVDARRGSATRCHSEFSALLGDDDQQEEPCAPR